MNIAENITELVGNTPLLDLSYFSQSDARIIGKMESFNPCSSVKDRIANAMISKAEEEGKINGTTTIVEPTSGNTGIGLAFVCAQRGYRLILTMPESMSIERRKLLKRLGAEIVLTPREEGMSGAVDKASEIRANGKNVFMPQQFINPVNPQIHYETTGPEIWADTDGTVDVLVAAVGTGGTISGIGRYLKEKKPETRVVAVEPADSPVISGGSPGPHKIQGIGAGFIPEILDRDIIDEVITVTDDDAFEVSKILATKQGVLAGISAGANVWASAEVSKRIDISGSTIVTIICDTGERYLSVWAE